MVGRRSLPGLALILAGEPVNNHRLAELMGVSPPEASRRVAQLEGDETYPHLLSAETLSIAFTSPLSCERSASRFASSLTGISVGERSA